MKEFDKLYYKIRDVASFLDENASTLRYWETEFPEIKPKRGEKGARLYTSKDIENLRIVKYLLRTKGMKIEAAREQLQKNSRNLTTRIEALNELNLLKADLEELLGALKKRK